MVTSFQHYVLLKGYIVLNKRGNAIESFVLRFSNIAILDTLW